MSTDPRAPLALNRRQLLIGGGALGALALAGPLRARAQVPPLLTAESTTIEVKGKAAKVFVVRGPSGEGIFAKEGDRLSGSLVNASGTPLQMHWHGQIFAPPEQDRARPDGTPLAPGGTDAVDYPLTPGTHWMHSHSMTEQQLLAAPLITREADAGEAQDVVVMLHDFAFRSPQEILAELGAAGGHGAHGAGPMPSQAMDAPGMGQQGMGHDGMGHDGVGHGAMGHGAMGHGGMGQAGMGQAGMGQAGMGPASMPTPPIGAGYGMGAGHGMGAGMMGGTAMGGAGMAGMAHANDVAYDAYLANRRTLADPEVVRVEKGAAVRLRIINGGTATAFFITVPGLEPRCVAVDGSPCVPVRAPAFPLAQGQRIDLVVDIPKEGGAFPVLAQVEGATARTGLILATAGATIPRVAEAAEQAQGLLDLSFESTLAATRPLAVRPADRAFPVMLGEEPGYRWTINGRVHGEDVPFDVRQGERVEMTFMNPTMMSHPMHIHGHHFQVVGLGGRRFSGPVRDTVIVPPHVPVTIAFDAGPKGEWFLHCHHLYHMAGGMMTMVRVA